MRKLVHQVQGAERWDTLAYHYYGSAFELGRLIAANPHLSIDEELPVGAVVFVPIIAQPTTDEHLPPWKRG